jgi:hypothetical protein
MPTRQLRNLTPPIADGESQSQWRIVGLERAHLCTFCGGPSEATVVCPDDGAPVLWQVARSGFAMWR